MKSVNMNEGLRIYQKFNNEIAYKTYRVLLKKIAHHTNNFLNISFYKIIKF